jgi:transcriptional regulator with XRE-family HTH domain
LAKTLRTRDHRALLAVLRASRAEAELTQRQVASRLGWTQSKYASVETGERRLDVVEFKQLAKVLKVDSVTLYARFARWSDG